MAISFPRDFPESIPFRSVSFEPIYLQARAPTRGGLQQVVDIGPALWAMKYETFPLREADAETWKAWLSSLRGGAKTFKAWNPVREFALGSPAGYAGLTRATGGSFADGTATLSGIGVARDTVTLATLPAGFVLTAGDMVSIPFETTKRSLHRVIEGGTASGGGGLTVTVEPPLNLGIVTGVSADLKRPWCHGVIDPASVTGPWQVGRRAAIAFSAVQSY